MSAWYLLIDAANYVNAASRITLSLVDMADRPSGMAGEVCVRAKGF
jgi:hypothetical protein